MRVLKFSGALVVAAIVTSILGGASASSGAEESWDAPVTVRSLEPDPELFIGQPHIASGGGLTHAIWSLDDNSDLSIGVSTSSDDGLTWGAQTVLSEVSEFAVDPRIAVDGLSIAAVWRAVDGTAAPRIQVATSTDGGQVWSAPVTVSAVAEFAYEPQIVIAGGVITVSWYAAQAFNRVHVSSSTDGGATWSTPFAVGSDGDDSFDARLATDGETVTIVYSLGYPPDGHIETSRSTDDGATWSTPIRLSGLGQGGAGPEVVTDGETITATWARAFGGINRVQVSSSTDGGANWSSPTTLSADGAEANSPSIATDGEIITVAWARAQVATFQIQSSSSLDGGATWSTPVTLSTIAAGAFSPQVAIAATEMTIIWEGSDGTTGSYVQGVRSTDGGQTFGAVSTLSAVGSINPQIAAFGTTTAVIWQRDSTQIEVSSYTTPIEVSRLSGADRYQTAVRISGQFASGVPVVYLATGTNYPDALSAASAAAKLGGPLLLTTPTSLPDSVADELQRLDPALVVIAGGIGVVTSAVEAEVAALLPNATIRRDSGDDRYATSRTIAQRAFPAGATMTAFIATGANFPDALSASAAAGVAGVPVILVDGSAAELDGPTRDLLAALGVQNTVIAGGTGVVSVGIETELLSTYGPQNVARLSGVDRYATSVAINRTRFATADSVFIATGLGYADALAGAALAGGTGSPLFVVPGTCVPSSAIAQFSRLGVFNVVLLGGTGALSAGVETLTPC